MFKHFKTKSGACVRYTKILKYSKVQKILLEKFWRISLYVTDDAIAKLYVT